MKQAFGTSYPLKQFDLLLQNRYNPVAYLTEAEWRIYVSVN